MLYTSKQAVNKFVSGRKVPIRKRGCRYGRH